MASRTEFIVAGLLIIAAVVFLIVSSTGSTARYFLTVEELRAQRDDLEGRPVTVSGAVLGDSISYDSSRLQVAFSIAHVPGDPQEVDRAGGLERVLSDAVNDPRAPQVDVVYDDVKPDLLQHQSQAIIRGHLGEDGIFYASEVLLKCPSRYEEALPAQAEGP